MAFVSEFRGPECKGAAANLFGMKKGLYSKNSSGQAAAVTMCERFLTLAAETVSLPQEGLPLTVAEWGCAHGSNSIHPVITIAEVLERRAADISESLKVVFMHEDIPSNDWGAVFASADEYRSKVADTCKHLSISSLAVGRSFYERNFPDEWVDIGFSFSALHWQSRRACFLSKAAFNMSNQVSPEERAVLRASAIQDLTTFLKLRAREFKQGGVLVASFVSMDEGLEPVPHSHLLDEAMDSMVRDGLLLPSELGHMAPEAYPLDAQGHREAFQAVAGEWLVLHYDRQLVVSPLWDQFTSGGMSGAEYAQSYANFWRAILEPSLVSGLHQVRAAAEVQALVDMVMARMETACLAQPVALSFVASRLVMKRK